MWKLGQKQKLEKAHAASKTRECVYVLSAVYVTAESLLRIFPKGSKLKKNTNFTLAYDLTGLDCMQLPVPVVDDGALTL